MPHRYQAPPHTSSISAPARDLIADEHGVIELEDDAPEHEHEYLRRAGCVPVRARASSPKKPASPKKAATRPKNSKPTPAADPSAAPTA